MKKLIITLAIIALALAAGAVQAEMVVVTWEHDGVLMASENCGDGTQCGFIITCALKSDKTNILARHIVKSASARQMDFEDISKFAPGVPYTFVGYAVNAIGQSAPSAEFEFVRQGIPYVWPTEQGMTTVYSAPGTTVNVNVICPSCP